MLGAKSHRALPEHSPDLMLAQKYQVHDSASLHICRRNIILKFQNNIFFQFEYRGYLLYIIALMHIKLLMTIFGLTQYSRTPVTRTLKGNRKQSELGNSGNSSYQGKF